MNIEQMAQLVAPGDATRPATNDRSFSSTLLDYLGQEPGGLASISRSPEAQALHLSSPNALGDKILGGMEGLHTRIRSLEKMEFDSGSAEKLISITDAGYSIQHPETRGPGPAAASGAAPKLGGNREAPGSLESLIDFESLERLMHSVRKLNDHHIEIALIAKTVGGSSQTVNTLLRAQ